MVLCEPWVKFMSLMSQRIGSLVCGLRVSAWCYWELQKASRMLWKSAGSMGFGTPISPLTPRPTFLLPPSPRLTVLSRVHLLRNLNQVAFLPGVESVARLHPNIYSSDLLWCKVFWGSLLEPCGVSVEYSLSSSLTSGTERCSSLPRATQLHGRILSWDSGFIG